VKTLSIGSTRSKVNQKTPNKQDLSEVVSCDLVLKFFSGARNGEVKISKEEISYLKKISTERRVDAYCIIDIWYGTKLAGYGDLLKPNEVLLSNLFNEICSPIKNKSPEDSCLDYVYLRTIKECTNQFTFTDDLQRDIKNNVSKDLEEYLYYLTHVIFFNLKFGLKKYDDLSKPTLEEIISLLTDPTLGSKILDAKYCDILGEILIVLILCGESNNPIFSKIEKIVENVKYIDDYHTKTVIKVYENLKNCERENPK